MNRLGRYELGALLGAGGGGSVYEATLVGPGGFRRQVALKVLSDGDEAIRREARISGLLRHRHIVDVYEIDEEDGIWFCAMELCTGGSLRAQLPLPPRAVVEVGLQVCEALEYAHNELGLVHRDIKPDNLLLGPGGEVKVADLGIARAAGFAEGASVAGTRGYMAPEQGFGGAVDARADVYALGMTLVELATGAKPGSAQTLTLGFLDDDGVEPSPDVPEWLAPAVVRCLEPDPEDRWPTMAALAEALATLDADGAGLVEALGLRPVALQVEANHDPTQGPEPDAFVGREADVVRIVAALDHGGLLALRGPPGIGKSRAALAAVRAWRARSGRPAWCVDLADVVTQSGLLGSVAAALGVPLMGGDPAQVLGHALASRGVATLVLDNADRSQVCGPILAGWVARAPELRLLLTSRAPVGLDSERVLEIGPLGLEACVELLRVRASQRGVSLENGPALRELAARLDGLPLALELAAGRLGVLDLEDVRARLDQGVLRSSAHGRHGTLDAALRWSWDQLDAHAREVLVQLAPFAGGFTLEAAEAVLHASPGQSAVDAVSGLIDRSLLHASGSRFGMLQTVRSFVRERAPAGEAEARHGAYFARFGEDDAIARLSTHGSLAHLQALAAERANGIVACRRAVDRRDGAVAAGTLRAVWAVLALQGPYAQASELADAVVGLDTLTPAQRARAAGVQARALRMEGRAPEARTSLEVEIALRRQLADETGLALARLERCAMDIRDGQVETAERALTELLEEARRLKDANLEVMALGNLAMVAHDRGQPNKAEPMYQRALALCEAHGNESHAVRLRLNLGILQGEGHRANEAAATYAVALRQYQARGDRRGEALVRGSLGTLYRSLGRLEAAREMQLEALALHRSVGYRRGEAYAISHLASVLVDEGRLEEAEAHYLEGLALSRELGDRYAEALALCNVGILNHESGARERAVDPLEGARALAEAIGNRRLLGMVLGELARAVGGPRAETLLDLAEAELRAVGDAMPLAVHWAIRAEVQLEGGDRAGAEGRLAHAVAQAPAGNAEAARYIDRVQALLQG